MKASIAKSLVELTVTCMTIFAITFSISLPSHGQNSHTSEQEAIRNQWETATNIAARIRAQLKGMENSDPQYNKLKRRLETVEENARQLARKVPGTPEYEQELRSKNGNPSGSTREESARSQSSGWYSSEAGRAQRAYEEQMRRNQEEALRQAQEQARESLESIQWLTDLIATFGNWSRGIPENYVTEAIPHIQKVARMGLPMTFGRPNGYEIGFVNIVSGQGQGNQAVQDRRIRRLWTDAFINAVDPQILEKQFVYLAPIVNQYIRDRIGFFGRLSPEAATDFIALARKMREPSQDPLYREYVQNLENAVNQMGAKTCNRTHGSSGSTGSAKATSGGPGSWFRFWNK